MDRLKFHLKETYNWVVWSDSWKKDSQVQCVNQERECFPFADSVSWPLMKAGVVGAILPNPELWLKTHLLADTGIGTNTQWANHKLTEVLLVITVI